MKPPVTGPRSVEPLKGAAPYLGGKRNLAKRLIARIESIEHKCYAEPFVGMGGVFFRRRQAPETEVINDRSRDVATFFRVLQRHYVPFVEMMRWQLTTRTEFERLIATDPATLTDLERAARFYYLQRTAFGGKIDGRNFGTITTGHARFDITRLAPELEELHSRLAGVVIECLPFEDFIPRYDRPHTLFYLDPPYFGGEADYGADLFARTGYHRLAELLAAIEGQFLLSINDEPEIREIFKGFAMEEVTTTYTVAGKDNKTPARELIISAKR
jgi:DNA adenine methylase